MKTMVYLLSVHLLLSLSISCSKSGSSGGRRAPSPEEIFDEFGFNLFGIHETTRTQFHPRGFDVNGQFSTYNENCNYSYSYDVHGFDRNKKHCKGFSGSFGTEYDLDDHGFDFHGEHVNGYTDPSGAYDKNHDTRGFDREGKHKSTHDKYDKYGFDRDGYNRYNSRYDSRHFDCHGKHRVTGTQYDASGYDRDGKKKPSSPSYDAYGFDTKTGKHKDTNTKYDRNGFDVHGKHRNGTQYNTSGYDRDGKRKPSPPSYDAYGFDTKTGKHRNGTNFDDRDFDINGNHRHTRSKYNQMNKDRDGHYKPDYNDKGFDRHSGKHKDTGTKYAPDGFDQYGTHRDTGTKYGPDGKDSSGRKATTPSDVIDYPYWSGLLAGDDVAMPTDGQTWVKGRLHAYWTSKEKSGVKIDPRYNFTYRDVVFMVKFPKREMKVRVEETDPDSGGKRTVKSDETYEYGYIHPDREGKILGGVTIDAYDADVSANKEKIRSLNRTLKELNGVDLWCKVSGLFLLSESIHTAKIDDGESPPESIPLIRGFELAKEYSLTRHVEP